MDSFALAGVYFPLSSTTPARIEGLTRTPSFAIVANTEVACIAVTEYPWPNEMVGSEVPDQSLTGCRIPTDSPGNFELVLSPIPNLRR
jgi:hypothetical protein